AGFQVPDVDAAAVIAGSDAFAVVGEGDARDHAEPAEIAAQLLAGLHVPPPNAAVEVAGAGDAGVAAAAGEGMAAVRREDDAIDPALMAFQTTNFAHRMRRRHRHL